MHDALGCGWKFPVRISGAGGVSLSRAEDKVRESIRIILGTAKGERVMRPDFGCDIHSYVFEVINTSTLTMVQSSIKDALVRWEPRIDLKHVDVTTERLDQGMLMIEVHYVVRSTNTEANLVYPFYLSPGG